MRPTSRHADDSTADMLSRRVKNLMQRHKDYLLDMLDDPTLPPGQRQQAQRDLNEVKKDIADSRYGASESQLQALWKKYR